MINNQAIKSLQAIIESSLIEMLNNNLLTHSWELSNDVDTKTTDEFYMLTISAATSRFIVLLHFNNEVHSRAAVAERLKVNESEVTENQFYDYVAEMGNVFAGSVKRNLGFSITYTGLSVPSRMSQKSLRYIEEIHYNVDIRTKAKQDKLEFMASLYGVAADDINILEPDLVSMPDVSDSGELEMF